MDSRSVGPEGHAMSAVSHSSRRNAQSFNTGVEDSRFIQVQTVKHIHRDADGTEVRRCEVRSLAY